MPRQDTTDFLTAFAVGTVLGIGATLLLRPAPASRKRGAAKQLRPYTAQLRSRADAVRTAAREGAGATVDMTSDFISAGRELLGEFRNEVAKIVGDARDELKDATEERVRGATRRTRKLTHKRDV